MITTICGIPCQVEVTHFSAAIQGKINAEVDYCYAPEDAEIEYQVLDRRGRPAPWLERKLTDAERGRIETELLREQES